ncbi:MAG: NAD kinase, partial [Lactobacillus iners]|nr:NAD kinase [Lactobacillus iners]
MKVAIVGNEQVKTQAVVKSLKRLLSQKQIDIDVENPDVVLTVGG